MIKRLEADRFKWPTDADVVALSVEQLHWLLAGIVQPARRTPQSPSAQAVRRAEGHVLQRGEDQFRVIAQRSSGVPGFPG
jgi:hypothetical protein